MTAIKFHKNLTAEHWNNFTLIEQLANIGSEIGRAINWRQKDAKLSRSAIDRGIELLDLSINDPKNLRQLRELLLIREFIADYFYFDNEYRSNDRFFQEYFDAFAYYAAISR